MDGRETQDVELGLRNPCTVVGGVLFILEICRFHSFITHRSLDDSH